MKNRATDQVLFVVIFTLIPKDQADNAEQQVAAQKDEKGNKDGAEKVETGNDDDDVD